MARITPFLLCAVVALGCASLGGLTPLANAQRGYRQEENLYDVLGVPRSSSIAEIKTVYKKIMRENHPSVQRSMTQAGLEESKQLMQKVSAAYKTLSTKSSKERYDEGYRGNMLNGNQGGPGGGPDKTYLRHHLFNDDFQNGEIFTGDDINHALQGKEKKGMVIFFWSANFPNCIDAALQYKKAVKRLSGITARVGSLRCDDHSWICQQMNLGPVPKVVGIRAGEVRNAIYFENDKANKNRNYEEQLLIEFILQFLPNENSRSVAQSAYKSLTASENDGSTVSDAEVVVDKAYVVTSVNTLRGTCPNVFSTYTDFTSAQREQGFPDRHFAAPYFLDTWKRSYRAEITTPFVFLEQTSCFDCRVELAIAIENYRHVDKKFVPRRIVCEDAFEDTPDGQMCASMRTKNPNRAWNVFSFRKVCFYATKKPYQFSNEHCNEAEWESEFGVAALPPLKQKGVVPTVAISGAGVVKPIHWFDNKYQSEHFLSFLLASSVLQATVLKSLNDPRVRKSEDCWAVLLAPHNRNNFMDVGGDAAGLHWHLLAARITSPGSVIKGENGRRVRIGVVDCSLPNSQCPAASHHRPFPAGALFSFGLKAKSAEVQFFDVTSVSTMVRAIKKDMDPLHLHVLTQKSFKSKFNAVQKKGRKWLILYNAGQWCPPCMQMKPQWPKVARRIQQDAQLGKRLSVAVVDCDTNRAVCQGEKIDGFPTIRFYPGGNRPVVTFGGDKNADAIYNWVSESLDSAVQKLGFQELQGSIQQQKTVLQSFTAGKWCPPCVALGPMLKTVANKLPKLTVSETNCDNDQQFCMQFGVDGYPSLSLYHKGQKHSFNSWKKTPDDIISWIQTTTGQKFV